MRTLIPEGVDCALAVDDYDLNVIDHAAVRLHKPIITHDLPAGGRRLDQTADGYVATIVSGQVIAENGSPTDARPGKLVRGRQPAPA